MVGCGPVLFSCLLFFWFFSLNKATSVRDPSDPLYGEAWNLHSVPRKSGESSLNVQEAWNLGFYGKGIKIATTGSYPNSHLEINGRFDEKGSVITNTDGEPKKTEVLSVLLGNMNNSVCSCGVAPLSEYVIFDSSNQSTLNCGWFTYPSDARIYMIDYVSEIGNDVHTRPGKFCANLWEAATARSKIVVTSSGSGGIYDNCNYDGYSQSRNLISIGSHGPDGNLPDYAEPCASTLVSGPGGMDGGEIPTSSGDSPNECKWVYGSEYAVSSVAGVIALMLEAAKFHTLTQREVARILVDTAIRPSNVDWQPNGAGYSYHPYYGFGFVNASGAVQKAMVFKPSSSNFDFVWDAQHRRPMMIFDQASVETTMEVDCCGVNSSFVQHVEVFVDIQHTAPGDLRISLISPLGTESVLAASRFGRLDSNRVQLSIGTQSFPIFKASAGAGKIDGFAKWSFGVVIGTCCFVSSCRVSIAEENVEILVALLSYTTECPMENVIENVLLPPRRGRAPDIVVVEAGENGGWWDGLFQNEPRPIFVAPSDVFQELEELPRDNYITILPLYEKIRAQFSNWSFSTTRNWGEPLGGTWLLKIEDRIPQDSGILFTWKLKFNYQLTLFTPSPSSSPTPSPSPTSTPSSSPSPTPTPSPFPSPFPTPSPIPSPTPSPILSSGIHCCVYSIESHPAVCTIENSPSCPDIPNYESEYLFTTSSNCKQICLKPSPTPSPFPSPIPSPTPTSFEFKERCCFYESEVSDPKNICFVAVLECPPLSEYSLAGTFNFGPAECDALC